MEKNHNISVAKVLLSAALVLSTVEQSSSMNFMKSVESFVKLNAAVCLGSTFELGLLINQDGAGDAVNYPSYRKNLLQAAVKTGSTDKVNLLISRITDVKSAVNEENLLHDVVKSGGMDMLILLIKSGADVHKTDVLGQTLLHEAVWRKNKRMVGLFVALGLDVGATDRIGITPMALVDRSEDRTPSADLLQRLLECPQDQRQEMVTMGQLLNNKKLAIMLSKDDVLSIDPSIFQRLMLDL
jgi:ankyrin repeat protein